MNVENLIVLGVCAAVIAVVSYVFYKKYSKQQKELEELTKRFERIETLFLGPPPPDELMKVFEPPSCQLVCQAQVHQDPKPNSPEWENFEPVKIPCHVDEMNKIIENEMKNVLQEPSSPSRKGKSPKRIV